MVIVENLATKLCGILFELDQTGEAKEWRLLGQEQDGSLLVTWIYTSANKPKPCSHIGVYSSSTNKLELIHTFDEPVNTIQGSINADRTLLGYVTKNVENGDKEIYKPFIVHVKRERKNEIVSFGIERSKQIMIQFLYRKQNKKEEKELTNRFLLLVHQESISMFTIQRMAVNKENISWSFDLKNLTSEILVKAFLWAQWDCVHQSVFYIHYRKPTKSLVEEEEPELDNQNLSPMLSGLQFHDEMPHETVLNIPLNLPQLTSLNEKFCDLYEDDTIPLRVHDCSLDLLIVIDSKGLVCICHYYLYRPVEPSTSEQDVGESSTVHLAYSVTLLHHGCVIHCIVPGIPWENAKTVRPIFALHGDHHMIVFVPNLFTHLLDIGVNHNPMCHVLMKPIVSSTSEKQLQLVPLLNFGKNITVNLMTLDLILLSVTTLQLIETFKNELSIENRISILHYLLVHRSELDAVSELISILAEEPMILNTTQILQEMLIGGAYATAQRNLPMDAMQLVSLLPVSTMASEKEIHIVVNKLDTKLSHEILWNTAMMLLSPQQRLVPYRGDVWTRLWELLARMGKNKVCFKPSQVSDKLMVSLVCYQPEALSRSSTPLSPAGALVSSASFSELTSIAGQQRKGDTLPFFEIESCTASKQEHVISVNLRELSMHLLKQTAGSHTMVSPNQWQSQTPIHVHAVATRYVSAQLEVSRHLCQILCIAAGADSRQEIDKGFVLIDQLEYSKQYVLFTLLERYYMAVDSIAFPLPQGFTSFFTFLGYRTLRFTTFMQYVRRNVFELQVDVMKIIMADITDNKEGVLRKLKLLSLLPRSRAKRLINQWCHPVSLMLRAREHAFNILSGVEGHQPRTHALQRSRATNLGLAAFPSADRLSPLDTFLDLLTAKASLAELDFGLLIDATITSMEDFLI